MDLKNNRTISYAKMTFILSIIGFIGSIGFYVGVLREVYSPNEEQATINVLQQENERLKKQLENCHE